MVSNGPPPRPTDSPTGQPYGQSFGQTTGQVGVPPAGAVQPQQAPKRRVPGKLIAAAIVLAIVVWFIVVNRQKVPIKLWVHTVIGPMWIVLLATLVVGFVVGYLVRWRRAKASRSRER